MVPLFVVLTILIFLTVDWFIQRRQIQRASAVKPTVTNEWTVNPELLPAGLFLDRGHTWGELVKDGEMRIGVDELPIYTLGSVERVELPSPGEHVNENDPLFVLMHDEREIIARSPVSGTVQAINLDAAGDPAELEHDPFGENWLVQIRPDDLASAFNGKLIGDSARNFLRDEFGRFRDFVASLAPGNPEFATLQDGGFPARGVLAHLPEEQWREVATWITARGAKTAS